jgi:hypothetical protein
MRLKITTWPMESFVNRHSRRVGELVRNLLEGGDGGAIFTSDSDGIVSGAVDRLEGTLDLWPML